MSDGAKQTPLTDLLASVPADGRHMYEHHSTHHQNVPYGRLCRDALTEIFELTRKAEKQRVEIEQITKDRDSHERLHGEVLAENGRFRTEIEQLRSALILVRRSALADDPAYDWLMRDIDRALTTKNTLPKGLVDPSPNRRYDEVYRAGVAAMSGDSESEQSND